MRTFYKYNILGFIVLILLASCSSSKNQPDSATPGDATIPFDTIQKAQVETMVNTISAGLREIGPPQKLAYPLYNVKDTIYYWVLKDDAARISIEWKPENEVIWPTFFVYQGELVFVRYRHLNETPPNSLVSETMIYLHDGKIVYCEERSQGLKEGELPGSLRQKGYSRTTRSYAEIEKDYKEYWKMVAEHMKKQNAFPSFIKM